eukprot:SAG31_NODE_16278_length_715_cov_1.866883_1_plen_59_part_00
MGTYICLIVLNDCGQDGVGPPVCKQLYVAVGSGYPQIIQYFEVLILSTLANLYFKLVL